jgi:hypothetical protein
MVALVDLHTPALPSKRTTACVKQLLAGRTANSFNLQHGRGDGLRNLARPLESCLPNKPAFDEAGWAK